MHLAARNAAGQVILFLPALFMVVVELKAQAVVVEAAVALVVMAAVTAALAQDNKPVMQVVAQAVADTLEQAGKALHLAADKHFRLVVVELVAALLARAVVLLASLRAVAEA
jgi:hypothetical protein